MFDVYMLGFLFLQFVLFELLVIVLPKKETSLQLRTVAYAVAAKTAKVTVLIPPAVPTGEPPMNIKIIETSEAEFVKFSCGIVAKPAVLVVTDWKNDACILWKSDIFPMVSGLLNSKIKTKTAPESISTAVVEIAILLCRVKYFQQLFLVFRSLITLITSHQTM